MLLEMRHHAYGSKSCFALAAVYCALGTVVFAEAEGSEVHGAARHLQGSDTPWQVFEGDGCELVEDGCIQTAGYPGNSSNSSCLILARLSAYLLEPISFDAGNDVLTVNGFEYSGQLVKRAPVFGQMLWNPSSFNSSWKICPRSSCTTMVCPPGYASKQGSQNIACSGLACNATMDLHTCCDPKCTVPQNFTAAGYALNADNGACPYATYPYYIYYSEATCSIACPSAVERFESAKDLLPVSSCPSPGEYLLPPPCHPRDEDTLIRWQLVGECEHYGHDCFQTTGFPSPYRGRCGGWLVGDYEITFTAFDVEEGFDVVNLGIFEADEIIAVFTGKVLPEPFVFPPQGYIQLELDDSIEGRGFRACARPLCSMVSCPIGYIFMCDAMDTACTDVECEDRNVTCCREAYATEMAGLNGSSDALSEGCLVNTTTTTTTTPRISRQIIGVTTFEVIGSSFNSSTLLDAWEAVLATLAQLSSEDVVLLPDDAPDSVPELTQWMVGFQLQNVLADTWDEVEEVELPFTMTRLQSYLAEAWMNVSGELLDDSVQVLANTATSGAGAFQGGVQPFCSDYEGWIDDWSASCILYDILCTPFGTSTFESFSVVPGYYWYFYSTVTRADENEPDAREACCACGGGECTAGGFQLRGTKWDFCAPCAGGWYSNEAAGIGLSCTQCEPGHYSTLKAASPSCTGASVGHYACCFGVTDEAETPCAIGTFASQEGQSACTNCPTGTFSSVIRSASCADCALGSFASVDGSTSCTACPTGTFANVTGRSLCFDCPAGSTATTGQTSCTACDPGSFNSAAGSVSCESCPLGQYATEAGRTQCKPCDSGYFASAMGQSTCDICPAGQQSIGSGATACEFCPLGKSKSDGDLLCSACAPGYYSSRLGDIDCRPCDAGQYVNESGASTCFGCPQGRASGTAGLAECPACLPGQYIGTEGETTCLQCIQGRIAEEAGAVDCVDCEPGFVAAAAGLTACTECAPGRHNPEKMGTRCEDCSLSTFADEYGMPECTACQAGRYALLPGLSACFDCEAGRYAGDSGSSDCTHCEHGRYASSSRSTSCRECSADLPGPAEHWTTMYPFNDTLLGEMRWEILFAATSVSSCGCKPGTQPVGAVEINYVDGGSPADALGGRGLGCQVCGEGLQCLGMGQLRISNGYAWDGELSVYDCTHAITKACRGGIPGACATGRDETKVACAECIEGWVAIDDGSCSACSGADYAVPITAMVCLILLAIVAYFIYDRKGARKRPSLTMLLMLICMGQLLTILQQLGIVSTIRVEWSSPLSDILDFISTIGFIDVDFLRPQCMVSMNPVRSYGIRVAAVYIALLIVVLAHALSTLVQHRGQRAKSHWVVLMCALGTIIMAFFVSIITTMLGPLQCKKHPNEARTISWYPSIVCWEDERHGQMLAIGIAACTLPLLFLVAASWAAYVFPHELKKGSPNFLTGWAFLFFRYHTTAYWYGPVQLARNALISVAPVFPTAVLQTLFLESVMLASLLVVARAMPWRAHSANYLEVVMHYVFLSLVLCACLYIDDSPASEIALFATFLILIMPLVVIALVVVALIKMCQSRGKPYQFFLCHHKVGAGSFCRLLKMRLLKMRSVRRKVFVDTDDLQNLGTLFDMVDQDTENLVAIHSSHLLTRPWCIGEISTAYRAKICIQVVRLHLVERPTDHFIENFVGFVPDVECLTVNGIGLELVQEALTHFQTLPAMHLPAELQDKSVTALGSALLGKMSATASYDFKAEEGEEVPERSVLIIADKKDLEGASTAFILRELLLPIITPQYEVTAHVLTHGVKVPVATISKVALICTAGLFENPVITTLLQFDLGMLVILPMMCSSAFKFPTRQVLREESAVVRALSTEEQDKLISITESIFTEIAVEFSPSALGASEAVLASRAQDVARRLWSNMQSISRRLSSASIKPKGGCDTLRSTSITGSVKASHPLDDADGEEHGHDEQTHEIVKGEATGSIRFEIEA